MGLRFDWPFSRRARASEPDNEPYEDPPALTLAHHGDSFTPTWRRQEQVSPGAEAYAWTSLNLPPFSYVGTGIEPGFKFAPVNRALVQRQSVSKRGIATQSGTVYGQPLFDPQNSGYNKAFTSALDNNQPFRRPFSGGTLDVVLY